MIDFWESASKFLDQLDADMAKKKDKTVIQGVKPSTVIVDEAAIFPSLYKGVPIHTPVNLNFTCPLNSCRKNFIMLDELHFHMAKNHGYPHCGSCSLSFRDRQELVEHNYKIHSGNDDYERLRNEVTNLAVEVTNLKKQLKNYNTNPTRLRALEEKTDYTKVFDDVEDGLEENYNGWPVAKERLIF